MFYLLDLGLCHRSWVSVYVHFTGQLRTQTLHIEVLVDLHCSVSEKLLTAEKLCFILNIWGMLILKVQLCYFTHTCGHRKKMKQVQPVLVGTHPIVFLSPWYSL